MARRQTVSAFLIHTIVLCIVACVGISAANAQTYVDCGSSCSDLAIGKPVSYSGLYNGAVSPPSKVVDGNTGTTSTCEGASGYCAIASDSSGGQAIGNYLQIDLGQPLSVKSVTVYGRRDTALTQGQNLNLKLSTDGTTWTTTYMADTTSSSGLTVSTASVARYVRVETTTVVHLSLYEITVTGTPPPLFYVDCGGSCTNLAPGKTVSYSHLYDSTNSPASKLNDTNTGTTSTCQGSTGYCAIASDNVGGQAIGNYFQIDLGQPMSVKSVTVYGRRDTALTQGQNLNLKLSQDGVNWTTTYMADTTNSSGLTVSTASVARYVRVETTTVVYLSLYEVVVTGSASVASYVDCGAACSNLAPGKTVSYSHLYDPTNSPASKVNDTNTGTTSTCQGSSGYCAIASDSFGGQAIGNYFQVDLGQLMSVKSVTVYGRRDTALTQGQNLNLKLSTDGVNWTTTYMADTTSSSGLTVSTATVARYVRVETTTVVYLSLYEIVVNGTNAYVDCGTSCSNLAPGKTVSYSHLYDSTNSPASKLNDTNTGTTSTCQGSTGYCTIASDNVGGQAVGNYFQIDLGQLKSVKSVTVYGRRDSSLTQGQNLNLKVSIDGTNWTTFYMGDTTSSSGLTVSTATVARYVRVETTTVVYLSLYEVVVTGTP